MVCLDLQSQILLNGWMHGCFLGSLNICVGVGISKQGLFFMSSNRAVVPTIQGYEDAGDFTVKERLKTSIHMNLLFYSIVGAIGLIGLILLLIMHRAWYVQSLLEQNFTRRSDV